MADINSWLRHGVLWAASLNFPAFLAGAGVGVPAGIAAGSTLTGDSLVCGLVTGVVGLLGGVAADHLSAAAFGHLENSFTCYDMLTRAAGPACLLVVLLSRGVRGEPSVAVKPVAAVAFAALLLEPVFNACILGNVPGAANLNGYIGGGNGQGGAGLRALVSVARRFLNRGRGRGGRTAASAAAAAAASAVARARWLAAGAQLALWVSVTLAYARLCLRDSRSVEGSRRTVAGYMTALRALAAKKRGSGGWLLANHRGDGGGGRGGKMGLYGVLGEAGGAQGAGGPQRTRAHSLLGSLYERLAGGGRGGGGVGADAMALCQASNGPPFERGEVTVRGIYCAGLDAAITGKPSPTADEYLTAADAAAAEGKVGADGGGGGGVAGGTSRPFYVTVALGNVTARTSVKTGFSPSFTEVFPLGADCPIRGAYLAISVVDSFEAGRSGRGDRVVGEVHVPLEAAQLVPGSSEDAASGGPAYRLRGDWELQGLLGAVGFGARVGADIVVRGPPSPTSAAGRLRRRRESVGWYAR